MVGWLLTSRGVPPLAAAGAPSAYRRVGVVAGCFSAPSRRLRGGPCGLRLRGMGSSDLWLGPWPLYPDPRPDAPDSPCALRVGQVVELRSEWSLTWPTPIGLITAIDTTSHTPWYILDLGDGQARVPGYRCFGSANRLRWPSTSTIGPPAPSSRSRIAARYRVRCAIVSPCRARRVFGSARMNWIAVGSRANCPWSPRPRRAPVAAGSTLVSPPCRRSHLGRGAGYRQGVTGVLAAVSPMRNGECGMRNT